MNISDRGIKFIEQYESIVLKIYDDGEGYATGGCGHLLTADEKAKFPMGTSITQQQCDEWFRADLSGAEKVVNSKVKVVLDQNEFDALVSLVFNIGSGNFGVSEVLRDLNQGNRSGAARAFLHFEKSRGHVLRGLVNRRTLEMHLFLT